MSGTGFHYVPSREEFKQAIDNSQSNAAAARLLGISYATFRKYATKYGMFMLNHNRSGKGIPKKKLYGIAPLNDVLNNEYPEYDLHVLRRRLFLEKLLPERCIMCGFDEARVFDGSRPLVLVKKREDDGITLDNLHLLCLNCRFLTTVPANVGNVPTTPVQPTSLAVPDLEDIMSLDEIQSLMDDIRSGAVGVDE